MLVPEAMLFITLLMRVVKLPVNSTEFIWYDDGAQNCDTQIDNEEGYAAGATTLKVKDAAFLRPKDLLKNTRTGEFFFSSRRRHTSCGRDWSSDVCSSDLA